jgi:mechanosensitive ion channel-like protein
VFGPNPVSQMLTAVIAYLPNVFAALIIVVIAGAIAAGVKQMVQAAIGGLRYGRMLGTIASVAVMFVGIFAALNQLNIAPAIVNGLFYAALVVVAGSATIAIGGGGIMPMRRVWDRTLNRMEQEAPRLKQEAAGASERIKERAEELKEKAKYEYAHTKGDHHEEGERETPRFKT